MSAELQNAECSELGAGCRKHPLRTDCGQEWLHDVGDVLHYLALQ